MSLNRFHGSWFSPCSVFWTVGNLQRHSPPASCQRSWCVWHSRTAEVALSSWACLGSSIRNASNRLREIASDRRKGILENTTCMALAENQSKVHVFWQKELMLNAAASLAVHRKQKKAFSSFPQLSKLIHPSDKRKLL